MSVYIKGMEMPTSCFYCPFRWKVDPDTFVCLATNEHIEETFAGTIETRNKGECPIIPVPDHGRLIDADTIHYTVGGTTVSEMDYVRKYHIDRMPTIIPASKGDGE